ncbi:YchJ family protein [Myroides sp. N17-2]|uniref:YchJ family protein n=1 Tax=Myroides sp. N17-2 TaxID=2030799 RepID=UPI000EFB1FB6|nr:YchJ family metal-binding protein [Myroides sp. N17-2]
MELEQPCYCCSGKEYSHCCEPFITLKENPNTAEQLMRSRYTAYALANAIYIVNTTHPKTRHAHNKKAILQWAKENIWLQLEIVASEESRVVFKAHFKDIEGNVYIHYEDSLFEILGGKWYYVSGTFNE